MNRREFVKGSALATVGALSIPSMLYAGKKRRRIGVQLYTLRDTITNDPKKDLQQVAALGVKKLETYGYDNGKLFGMTIKEFASFTGSLDMKVTSGHYGIEKFSGDTLKKVLDDAKYLGQEYVVLPWINENERRTLDDYKKICEKLNNAGTLARKYNLRVGYHNHAFEFEPVEGQIPYDLMLKELDPAVVGMEMDIFWVVNAGKDPLAYFEKYPGRFDQWHVKDMDKDDRNKNADIGKGTIDWRSIFAGADKAGLKHFYIEQETYPGAPIDSVRESVEYLRKQIL